jgi:hypothetical protein
MSQDYKANLNPIIKTMEKDFYYHLVRSGSRVLIHFVMAAK